MKYKVASFQFHDGEAPNKKVKATLGIVIFMQDCVVGSQGVPIKYQHCETVKTWRGCSSETRVLHSCILRLM